MLLNQQRRVRIDLRTLRRFLPRLSRAARVTPSRFSVALVSDRRMAALNRRYRRQPRATDVLSFPAGGNGYLGDVVISADTARRQAREFGHSLSEEIKLLMLHGLLHLMGYDHERDTGQMNRREHALRRRLGLE
ncbi:MAG TPA: rRNA maturation RNase YbeY [Candidatus Xenobia bacterium]|nr:rRNA maturation RNase YbeY [Candidatus Xenobia bacterium]